MEEQENSDIKSVRINVDMPPWMFNAIDRESTRLGVARQALVKMWLAEKIEERERRG